MTAVDKNINQHNAGWSFENISEDFDAHIQRSIPLYESGHKLICHYSDFFLKADSLVYDIGCSTGQMLGKLARHHCHKNELRLVGIDNVRDMVDKARETMSADRRVGFTHANVLDVDLEASDMIVSNYTIQFLPPRVRQELIEKIYRSLNWGGAFFMFEKVRAPAGRFQDYANQAYVEFKLENGFNEAEIINKDGGEVIACEADMTRRAEVDRLLDAAGERFGRVDVMVSTPMPPASTSTRSCSARFVRMRRRTPKPEPTTAQASAFSLTSRRA